MKELIEKCKRRLKKNKDSGLLKLDTVLVFKILGTSVKQMAREISTVRDYECYTFQEDCFTINDHFFKVTELHFLVNEEQDFLEDSSVLEDARMLTGVTSFGSGPDLERRVVVFEVWHTLVTYWWSDYEMPMPTIGGCFLVSGDERKLIQGPKFPMSHLLYGVGSEVPADSSHRIYDDVSISLKADFVKPSWFIQREYHRIVTPGMSVPEILPLQIDISGVTDIKDVSLEPILVSEISIQLEEFTSVWRDGKFFKEVRSKTLLENKSTGLVYDFGATFIIPPQLYNCKLPEVGPSFFSQSFTRSYGLRLKITLFNESLSEVTLSTFFELNMARVKYERLKESDIHDDERYLGEKRDVKRSYLMEHHTSKLGINDFFALFMRKTRKSYPAGYLFRSWQHGSKRVLFTTMEAIKPSRLSKFSYYERGIRTKDIPKTLIKPRGERFNDVHVKAKVIDKPISCGSCSVLRKLNLSVCVMRGNKVVGNFVNECYGHYRRAIPDSSFRIGKKLLPLTIRLTRCESERFEKQSRWDDLLLLTPGLKFCEFFNLTFMLPRSFEKANLDSPMENFKIQLEHIEMSIYMVCEDGYYDYMKRLVINKDLNDIEGCSFWWSEFCEGVPESLQVRAFTLPSEVFDGLVPPYTGLSMSHSAHLSGRLLFTTLNRNYAYTWENKIMIAQLCSDSSDAN